MINIKDIENFFPELSGRSEFKEYMLKEYLQYQILDIIFNSPYAKKLSFIGGTNLRIIYHSKRFSEDLDFDNFHLKKEEFDKMVFYIADTLIAEGFNVVVKEKISIKRIAFQKYLHFPGLMFQQGLSPHKDKRFFIKIDSESQNYKYIPQKGLIQKFDVITPVYFPPVNLMLSMKIKAFFFRKKTRDCFDIMQLFSMSPPDYKFLKDKLNINGKDDLRKKMANRCKTIDFKQQVRDIEPFLFNIRDKNKIILFPDFIEHVLTK